MSLNGVVIFTDFAFLSDLFYTKLKPMHEQFIEPSKEYADIIIPTNRYNTVAVEIVRTIIDQKLS